MQPYTDLDEAITLANATTHGLGASVWGKDVSKAEEVGRQLEAGTVWINSWGKPDARGMFCDYALNCSVMMLQLCNVLHHHFNCCYVSGLRRDLYLADESAV